MTKRTICKSLLLVMVLACHAFAQAPPVITPVVTFPLSVGVPFPPTPGGPPAVSGTPGTAVYYYWLVTESLAGNSAPSGPFAIYNAPNTLSGSNFVFVGWNPVPGAISYDVLRTTTTSTPGGACNCAVVVGTSSTTANDQSNSLNSYTVATFQPQNFQLSLDNEVVGANSTHLILRRQPGGAQLADLNVSTTGLPSTGSTGIVYQSGPSTTRVATSADIIADFTGCSGTQYLGADGACHSAGTGTITGSGTNAFLPLWNGTGALTNSVVQQASVDSTTALQSSGGILQLNGHDSVDNMVRLSSGANASLYGIELDTITGGQAPSVQVNTGGQGQVYIVASDGGEWIFQPGKFLTWPTQSFSTLPSPVAGYTTYCTNCTPNSNPCNTTTPTGAWAYGNGTAWVCVGAGATGGLGDPGANGIVKRTALNTTTVAASADVVGLFSTCSGTQYLGADGACHSAGTGTITGVTAGTGLTGGGSSGSVTVNLAGALPNGQTATTQTAGDNTTKVATDAFVQANGTVTSGNAQYTAGYTATGTAVGGAPVNGLTTNNDPSSGADFCVRAYDTLNQSGTNGVAEIIANGTGEASNASSGSYTCSVNPWPWGQQGVLDLPPGVILLQYPMFMTSDVDQMNGYGRGGTQSNNTVGTVVEACQPSPSGCVTPTASAFHTGGVGSGLNITWSVTTGGDLTANSTITSGGSGYWQPTVSFASNVGVCSAFPVVVLNVKESVVVGFTQIKEGTCGTAGSLTPTYYQGPSSIGQMNLANNTGGQGPLSPVAVFSTGMNNLMGQASITSPAKNTSIHSAASSYNESIRLGDKGGISFDTGGLPGVAGVVDNNAQDLTEKHNIKISASQVAQLIVGGGSQNSQNGGGYFNLEMLYPSGRGCDVDGGSSATQNGTPIPINSWSTSGNTLTINGTAVVSGPFAQSQPFTVVGAAIGTGGVNINNTLVPPLAVPVGEYVNFSPNQTTTATVAFNATTKFNGANSTGGAGGWLVPWPAAVISWENPSSPMHAYHESTALGSNCAAQLFRIATSITATSITSNVLTVNVGTPVAATSTPAQYNANQMICLSGTAESFLNNQCVVMSAVTPSSGNTTSYTAPFTHANFTNASDTGTSTPPGFPGAWLIAGSTFTMEGNHHVEGYDTGYSTGDFAPTSDVHISGAQLGTDGRNCVFHVSANYPTSDYHIDRLLGGGAGGAFSPLNAQFIMCDEQNGNWLAYANNAAAIGNSVSDYNINTSTVGDMDTHANCLGTHTNLAGATVNDMQNGKCTYNGITYTFSGGLIVDKKDASGNLTVASVVDTGISSGTSPICPNGTGGAFTTSGCTSSGGPGTGTQFDVPYWATTSTLGSVGGSTTVTGQLLTFQTGAAPIAASPSMQDSSSSPVTSSGYTLQCDSSTTIIDRAHTVRFQSGASAPVVPLSSASGCSGLVTTVMDDGAGSLVFGRTSPDTFSVYNGLTNSTGQTSFTLLNGQFATLNQAASGIWEVRLTQLSNLGTPTTLTLTNATGLPLAGLATEAANTVVANVTGSTAVPTAAAIPSGIQNYVANTGYNQATAHQMAAPLACNDASGSGTTQSCNTTPSFTPAAKDCINYTPGTTITGALTLNVNATSAANVQKWLGTALASGDLVANKTTTLCFDGTNWQTMTIGNAPSGAGCSITNTDESANFAVSFSTTVSTLYAVTGNSGQIRAAVPNTVPATGQCPVIIDNQSPYTVTIYPGTTGANGAAIGTVLIGGLVGVQLRSGQHIILKSDGTNYTGTASGGAPNPVSTWRTASVQWDPTNGGTARGVGLLANFGNSTSGAVSPTTTEPSYQSMTANATTINLVQSWNQSGQPTFAAGHNTFMRERIKLTGTTNQRVWADTATSASTGGMGGTDTPAASAVFANGVAFRYSTSASDTNWMACTFKNSTGLTNCVSTGVAAGTTGVTLAWQDLSNLPTPGVAFYVNGSETNFSTTDYPDTSSNQNWEPMLTQTQLTAAAQTIDWNGRYVETDQ
jgi:hypothetical protein